MKPPPIPAADRRRTPLTRPAWQARLKALREDPDAPAWNYAAGDRLGAADLRSVERFRKTLSTRPADGRSLPTALRPWLRAAARSSPFHAKRLAGLDLGTRWLELPTMSRGDLVRSLTELVPDGEDLGPLIVYDTTGTTGPALRLPHHPRAAACYQPLLEAALALHGLKPRFSDKVTACVQVVAAANSVTVTYPAVLAAWKGAGFARVNLHPSHWPAGNPVHWFRRAAPLVVTGDPVSFSELLRLKIDHRPLALVSTATALGEGLRRRLEKGFRCPVIDWYSLTETGPIAATCPKGAFHQLPPDLHLECLDEAGRPVPSGLRGELTVTGGRNPYLPLVRYRTGDWGRLEDGRCACGRSGARILELEGRAPAVFRAADGSVLNPIDLARALRAFPLAAHELVQRADLSCEVVVRSAGAGLDGEDVRRALVELFGAGIRLAVRVDPALGDDRPGGKVVAFRSELPL